MFNPRQGFIPFIGRKDHNYYGGFVDDASATNGALASLATFGILTTAANTRDYLLRMTINIPDVFVISLNYNGKRWWFRGLANTPIQMDWYPVGLKLVGSNTLTLRNEGAIALTAVECSFQYVHFVD